MRGVIRRNWLVAVVLLAACFLLGRNGAYPDPAHAAGIRWRFVAASAYGPGLYGNTTACPRRDGTRRVLTRRMVGVAHRTLPCNSRVTVCYRKRCAHLVVIDRGPFASGRAFDLTEGTTRRVWHLSACGWGVRRVEYTRGWH